MEKLQPKNRPVLDRKTSKSKKTEASNRGAADSKKSAKIINKNGASEIKQIKPDASKEHIDETEDQVSLVLPIIRKTWIQRK